MSKNLFPPNILCFFSPYNICCLHFFTNNMHMKGDGGKVLATAFI